MNRTSAVGRVISLSFFRLFFFALEDEALPAVSLPFFFNPFHVLEGMTSP